MEVKYGYVLKMDELCKMPKNKLTEKLTIMIEENDDMMIELKISLNVKVD